MAGSEPERRSDGLNLEESSDSEVDKIKSERNSGTNRK